MLWAYSEYQTSIYPAQGSPQAPAPVKTGDLRPLSCPLFFNRSGVLSYSSEYQDYRKQLCELTYLKVQRRLQFSKVVIYRTFCAPGSVCFYYKCRCYWISISFNPVPRDYRLSNYEQKFCLIESRATVKSLVHNCIASKSNDCCSRDLK